MQMQTIKIQLTLPALERLLGGDSALEIELRHQVASQFADKHLKPLINSPELRQAVNDIKEAGAKLVKETLRKEVFEVRNRGGYATEVKLPPEAEEAIKSVVVTQGRALVQQIVVQALDAWTLDKIEALVDLRLQQFIEGAVADMVKLKMKEKMEEVRKLVS